MELRSVGNRPYLAAAAAPASAPASPAAPRDTWTPSPTLLPGGSTMAF